MNILCYVIGHNYGPIERTEEGCLVMTQQNCMRRGCTQGIATCESADGEPIVTTEAHLIEMVGRGLKVTVDGKRVKVAK